MAASTDSFKFNDLKLFIVIRECLPVCKKNTQNLVECKDDILFTWNSKDFNILAINWRAAKSKPSENHKYQTLIPSSSFNFTVEKILSSNEGSFLALSGSQGVLIVELPRRWGSNGQFQNGKESIICRIYNLDEHLFADNPHLEVLQIRWHPSSPTDSHLLVLLSDNTIRVYETNNVRHVWRVGPLPCMGSVKVPLINSLGETAVDFDIGPPRIIQSSNFNDTIDVDSSIFGKSLKKDSEKVEWPILVLRGDGNVFILCAGLDTERPKLQGPLTILPRSDDNYGLESCSLIVIPSQPPTVVISECNGNLHHALLIEEESLKDNSFNEFDVTVTVYPSEWYLQVLETVELELGLPSVDDAKDFSCPIYLKKDLLSESRYFAYHNAGLHAISIGFIHRLHDFIERGNELVGVLNGDSKAEYVVCTKAFKSMDANPVLGFTLLNSPSGLLILLASGQVVSLDLVSDTSFLKDLPGIKSKSSQGGDSPGKKILKDSFQDRIKDILIDVISQPILRLDRKTEPTPQEAFELLTHATQLLREKKFAQHERARNEIEKRVHVLKLLKQQQLKDIADLQKEKETIRDKAEQLAEKIEDTFEVQNSLMKRTQELVRLATLRLPKGSFSEKKYAETIEKILLATKTLTKNMEMLKVKMSTQQIQLEQSHKATKEKGVILPPRQTEIVKQILTELTAEIDYQMKDIKKVNNIINLT